MGFATGLVSSFLAPKIEGVYNFPIAGLRGALLALAFCSNIALREPTSFLSSIDTKILN
jgi:hypothetical protein